MCKLAIQLFFAIVTSEDGAGTMPRSPLPPPLYLQTPSSQMEPMPAAKVRSGGGGFSLHTIWADLKGYPGDGREKVHTQPQFTRPWHSPESQSSKTSQEILQPTAPLSRQRQAEL